MPKLHELAAAYSHIDAFIEDEALTAEQLATYIDTIEGALMEKGVNIAKLIENLESTADNIKAAEARMAARRKAIENRADNIRNYLLTNMVNTNIHKIECEYFKISVRDTPPSVVVDDMGAIPSEYMNEPKLLAAAPDKKKILDDLKQGVVIEGVHMERGKFLQIR